MPYIKLILLVLSVSLFAQVPTGDLDINGTSNVVFQGKYTGALNGQTILGEAVSNVIGTGVQGSGNKGVVGQGAAGNSTRIGVIGQAVNGTLRYGLIGKATGGTKPAAAYFAGNIYHSGAWSGSDSCIKQDIMPLKHALADIKKIRGVRYQYKKGAGLGLPEGDQMGVIAQEVEKYFPQCVATMPLDETGTKSGKCVDYLELIPVLIKAVQEQQLELDELMKLASKK